MNDPQIRLEALQTDPGPPAPVSVREIASQEWLEYLDPLETPGQIPDQMTTRAVASEHRIYRADWSTTTLPVTGSEIARVLGPAPPEDSGGTKAA